MAHQSNRPELVGQGEERKKEGRKVEWKEGRKMKRNGGKEKKEKKLFAQEKSERGGKRKLELIS